MFAVPGLVFSARILPGRSRRAQTKCFGFTFSVAPTEVITPGTPTILKCASDSIRPENARVIELLELDQTGIHVAEYLTELPPRQLLEQKLAEGWDAQTVTHMAPARGRCCR